MSGRAVHVWGIRVKRKGCIVDGERRRGHVFDLKTGRCRLCGAKKVVKF